MGKLGFTTIFVMMCGLFGALDVTSGAATAAPVAAVATEAAASCDSPAATELACSGHGWIATLTCCGNGTERWTRSGQTKCCGPCFLP